MLLELADDELSYRFSWKELDLVAEGLSANARPDNSVIGKIGLLSCLRAQENWENRIAMPIVWVSGEKSELFCGKWKNWSLEEVWV